MHALRLLTDPRDELRKMLERFEHADDAKQRQLFLRIADNLAASTHLEEQHPSPPRSAAS